MNAGRVEDLMVHLTPGDARTTHGAGVTYARALAGAATSDFLDALAEQEGLIIRWVIDAGFSAIAKRSVPEGAASPTGDAEGARSTGREFKTAAQAEWSRITGAGSGAVGRA